jgi:hypothetical protein
MTRVHFCAFVGQSPQSGGHIYYLEDLGAGIAQRYSAGLRAG